MHAARNRSSTASTKRGSSYRYQGRKNGGCYQQDNESCGLIIALLAISLSGFRPLVASDLRGAQGDLLLKGEFHAHMTQMMTQHNAGTLRSLLYKALKIKDLEALCRGIAGEIMEQEDAKAKADKKAKEKKQKEEAAKKEAAKIKEKADAKAKADKEAKEKKQKEEAAKKEATKDNYTTV